MSGNAAADAACDVACSIGPFMYGMILSELLAGIILAQAFEYFRTCRDDRITIKATVSTLVIFTIATVICNVLSMKFKFLDNFDDQVAAYNNPTSNTVQEFLAPLMCAICQAFFAHRTYSATKNVVVLGILTLLLLGTLGAGWAQSGISLGLDYQKTLVSVQIYSWLSFATDICISAVFIYSLSKVRKEVKDDALPAYGIVGKLLVMSFETTVVTTSYTQQQLFVITVLFVLNSRKHLREYHGEMSSSHNKALTTNRRMFTGGATHNGPNGQISVTLQTFTKTEGPAEDTKNHRNEWPDPELMSRGGPHGTVTFDEGLVV